MGLFLGIVLSVGGVALAQFGACNAVNELLERKSYERNLAFSRRLADERKKQELEFQEALKEAKISD